MDLSLLDPAAIIGLMALNPKSQGPSKKTRYNHEKKYAKLIWYTVLEVIVLFGFGSVHTFTRGLRHS